MSDEKRQEVTTDEFLFLSLTKLLAEQAWIALGRVVHPETGESQKDLPQARGMIDILGVLEKRTAGNLTTVEESVLKQELTNLRLTYVADTEGKDGGEGTSAVETAVRPETDEAPSDEASAAGKAGEDSGKEGRIVEEDEDGRPKVVDRRSSTADRS